MSAYQHHNLKGVTENCCACELDRAIAKIKQLELKSRIIDL